MHTRRKLDWLKMRPPSGRRFIDIKSMFRDRDLNTVCEEANCPSLGECRSGRDSPGVVMFMLMGDRCLHGRNSCDVTTGGIEPLDSDEPVSIADVVTEVDLGYVVLTSVDRGDLPDQGAAHFAGTIREIRHHDPEMLVEVLVPDFQDDPKHVRKIINAGPGTITHNVETVERLQQPIRDRRVGYEQSLSVLQQVTDESDIHMKTSVMLGLGEHVHEVYQTFSDLCEADVDTVTFGQYPQPSRNHLDVFEYVHPDAFETWRRVAEDGLGFLYRASGLIVRSSYKAGKLFVDALLREGSSVEEMRRAVRAAARQQVSPPS